VPWPPYLLPWLRPPLELVTWSDWEASSRELQITDSWRDWKFSSLVSFTLTFDLRKLIVSLVLPAVHHNDINLRLFFLINEKNCSRIYYNIMFTLYCGSSCILIMISKISRVKLWIAVDCRVNVFIISLLHKVVKTFVCNN